MTSDSLAVAAASSAVGDGPSISEFEATLERLINRIARILQADKCVFLLHVSEQNELRAVAPTLGLTVDQVTRFRCAVDSPTISAEVFRTSSPIVINQPESDPRSVVEGLAGRYGAHTVLCVPLIIERRNDENKVVERNTIGVLHVFNKNISSGDTEAMFNEDDMRLLQRMALTAASIISSAQVFREVVQEKQELIHTIESLSIGLIVIGVDGRIMQLNPSARVLLRVPEGEQGIGALYSSVIGHVELNRILANSLGDDAPKEVNGEISIKLEKGSVAEGDTAERIFQVQCAPVRGEVTNKIVGIVVLLNDVTEIHNVERLKMNFISTVSHELRTPLTSIKGFIATLLLDTEGFYDKEAQREFYSIINQECDRLTRLIEDLLNVSRIEQGKTMRLNFQQMDVPAVIWKVIVSQKAASPDLIHELEASFEEDFPLIEADQDKIDQIFTNLVNNAIKYSPHGGKVSVTGEASPDRQNVVIRISDQGIGIPREHIKRIFERFHRVDNRDNREIGGTGIGLFLVKSLVDAHHGTVKVESEVGRGSKFTVTLPVRQPEPSADKVVVLD